MKIFLIRHGETDWNLQGRFQGREDIALNEKGILQAKLCGIALKGETFKAVITSPLGRAKRTAEIVAENIEVQNILIDKDLTERDFSKVSGMTPAEREVFYHSGQKDDKEPWEDLRNRMMFCIKKYADMFYDENIIMVSHGASINSVLSVLSGGEVGTRKTILKNACINIITYEGGNMGIERFNITAEEYQADK